jgi:sulfur carrier protein
MSQLTVTANGQEIAVDLPCSLEEFLRARHLPIGSVVVEHNGNAVAPSEFSVCMVSPGDRLEIIRVVAGG